MDLREYITALPRGGVAELAGKLGISTVYLAQISARTNGREPSPSLCVLIEQTTFGQVMRWDMRPTDWHLIWPELKGRRDAPPISTAEAA